MYSHKTKLHMFVTGLVIIGALNWGFEAAGMNLVQLLENTVNESTKSVSNIKMVVYSIIAFAGLYLALQRDTWLPFLGSTVLPMQLLAKGEPANATKTVKVQVLPHQHVVYWAALPKGDNVDVNTAYGDYSNSGVTVADDNGVARLHVIEGSGYYLPGGTYLDRHVHYRVIGLEHGFMGPIHTIEY